MSSSTYPRKSSMKRSSSDHYPKRSKQQIRFNRLEVIEFQQILGDNPACTSGAPLALDWKPVKKSAMIVDFYEFSREDCRRRTKSELYIKKDDRQTRLTDSGFELEEISAVEEEIIQIRKKRAESAEIKSGKWHAGFLSAAKSAVKTMGLTYNKEQTVSARSA